MLVSVLSCLYCLVIPVGVQLVLLLLQARQVSARRFIASCVLAPALSRTFHGLTVSVRHRDGLLYRRSAGHRPCNIAQRHEAVRYGGDAPVALLSLLACGLLFGAFCVFTPYALYLLHPVWLSARVDAHGRLGKFTILCGSVFQVLDGLLHGVRLLRRRCLLLLLFLLFLCHGLFVYTVPIILKTWIITYIIIKSWY